MYILHTRKRYENEVEVSTDHFRWTPFLTAAAVLALLPLQH